MPQDRIASASLLLFGPRWPWRATRELTGKLQLPRQYLRSLPSGADIARGDYSE